MEQLDDDAADVLIEFVNTVNSELHHMATAINNLIMEAC